MGQEDGGRCGEGTGAAGAGEWLSTFFRKVLQNKICVGSFLDNFVIAWYIKIAH